MTTNSTSHDMPLATALENGYPPTSIPSKVTISDGEGQSDGNHTRTSTRSTSVGDITHDPNCAQSSEPTNQDAEAQPAPKYLTLLPERTFKEPPNLLTSDNTYTQAVAGVPGLKDFNAKYGPLEPYLHHFNLELEPPKCSASTLISVCDLHDDDDPCVRFCRDLLGDNKTKFQDAIHSAFPADVSTRLVVVEDFCPLGMFEVGEALPVPLEMFLEHLVNAGYGAADPKHYPRKLDSRYWATAPLRKDHVSLAWFRPVCRRLSITTLSSAWVNATTFFFDSQPWKRTNIHRESWNIALDHNRRAPNAFKDAVPDAIWEERMTLARISTELGNYIVVLLDPLPWITPDDEMTPLFPVDERGVILPFDQVMPRDPPLDEPVSTRGFLRNKAQYDNFFLRTKSTARSLGEWMVYHNQFGKGPEYRSIAPMLGLLSMVHRDSTSVLRGIEAAFHDLLWLLDNAYHNVSELNITQWIRMLRCSSHQLQGLGDGLDHTLLAFLSEAEMPKELHKDFDNLTRKIRITILRCESLQQSMRAELSSMETKRSIAEAGSLARLTELAFVFIPLTFAASLFSMQVKELQTPPSTGVFVATAFAILFLSYGTRLLQGPVTRSLDKTRRRIRVQQSLPVHRKLTYRTILRWAVPPSYISAVRYCIQKVRRTLYGLSHHLAKIHAFFTRRRRPKTQPSDII